MTEHPLLLSTPMVLSYLAGLKFCTRRIPTCTNSLVDGRRVSGKKWKAYDLDLTRYQVCELEDAVIGFAIWSNSKKTFVLVEPIYQPGDTLWFRETWAPDGPVQMPGYPYQYKATLTGPDNYKWRPSIHMPKSACRLWADCDTVTCEHLQDITEEQAEAEGVDKSFAYEIETPDGGQSYTTYRAGFKRIWEQLHGPDSFTANPPVYAIKFNPITRKP